MLLTYRYRLLPSKKQHRALEATLEAQRQLYNAALQERIDAYRLARITRTYIDQTKALTEWRRDDPEARELPANLQRATLKRVDVAYLGFIRRAKRGVKAGFPRFRGKGRFHSFGFRQFSGIELRGHQLRFKGMPGCLRVHLHRPLPDAVLIRSCDFRRDAKGWFVSFALKLAAPPMRAGSRAVGLDLGISTFATLSDGRCIPSLKAGRRAERELRIAQRALSRKHRKSNSRHKARLRVARCHAATARRRANHLNQASALLVRSYEMIACEALVVRNLVRSDYAKDIYDASWGRFLAMLEYKAEKAGTRVIKVDPRHTSQDCSGCGAVVSKGVKERRHECTVCGLSLDRDLNAALNVLNRAGVGPGLHNVAESGMRAGGNLESKADPSHFPSVQG